MRENIGKSGFFAALWGVCCGTSVFPQLVKNTRSRTVWHLFLMSLLCTVLLSLRMFPFLRSEWKSVAKRYVEVFGTQIEFSDAGISPEDENRSRNMPLPNSGCLVYTAAREKEITLPEDLSRANYLVVWNGNFIAFAFTGDSRHWEILLSRPHRSNERRRVDRENLAKYFNDELTRPNSRENWPLPGWTMRAEDVFSLASVFTSAWWFVLVWCRNFILGILCTGLFSGVARLSGAATARGLTGWQYWKIGVYAGFPGMLIGSVVEALELPVLGYLVTYALTLVIYWLPAALACSRDREDGGGRSAA